MRRIVKRLSRDKADSFDLLRIVLRGMVLVLTAVGLTLFLPGLVAAKDSVFYEETVRNKLPASATLSLKAYEEQKQRLNESVVNLRRKLDLLDNANQQKDFDFYIHVLEQRQREISGLQPPVFIVGFFLSPQMLLWPAIYSSLSILLFCTKKPAGLLGKRKQWIRLFLLGTFIYAYYEWPLWVRNFLLGSHGRTVYAYTNYDIDPYSFLAQEGLIAGFAFLVAGVWLRWTDITDDREKDRRVHTPKNYLTPESITRIQQEFSSWLVTSFILGLGFVYFTNFFWSLVAKYHDQRYIISAFLAHSLWAVTWVFISVPLYKEWNILKSERLNAINRLITANSSIPGKTEQLTLEGLEKLESLAGVRISIASIGAVISLILPIIQLFLPKSK